MDNYTDHSMLKILAGMFIVGLLWGAMHQAPTGGPTEHKCLIAESYERC